MQLGKRVLSSCDITGLVKNSLYLCARSVQYKNLTLDYALSTFLGAEIQSASVLVRSEIQSATLFRRAIVTLQLLELTSRGFTILAHKGPSRAESLAVVSLYNEEMQPLVSRWSYSDVDALRWCWAHYIFSLSYLLHSWRMLPSCLPPVADAADPGMKPGISLRFHEANETFEHSTSLHKSDLSHEPITSTPRVKIIPMIESLENVFEMTEDSLATKVQNQLQTSEGREALRTSLGPLGQKYVEAVLRGAQDKESGIVDELPRLVSDYNARKHRTIDMRSADVTPAIAERLLDRVYNAIKIAGPVKSKVGDSVRVSKYKTIFENGYTPNWTTKVFTIVKVQRTNPVIYLLEDYRGKSVVGAFYEHELHRATHPDVYLVEKVLRRKGDKVYVKWLGFDGSHNSWIHKNNVICIFDSCCYVLCCGSNRGISSLYAP
ncbi:hypothetical protein ALC57_05300 [Trachymyrmex cornetzi]|uniref:Chromo domain-containing protein n=1 Tax=Trachymyrmex cornetzi TaxID=471704 RepID=A0A151JB16_9HYME|nr:hypothetical protein ALC57_05300 [Trachymyrmex cornetzi]